jgi:hypothetical protein
MKRAFLIPPDHDLLYQDDELIITISDQQPEDPEDCFGEEYIRGHVYFWDFDQDEDDDNESGPVRWLDGENKTIIIQRTEDPSESVACLNVEVHHGDWGEEQYFYVSAKAAQFLAKRFKRTLKVAQGYPLKDNQEILHEDDQFVVVLTKQETLFDPNMTFMQFVQFTLKSGAEVLVWHDDEDKIITIKIGSMGEYGLITVSSLNTDIHKMAIPSKLARILADRFGKQIVNGDPIKETKIPDAQPPKKIEKNITKNEIDSDPKKIRRFVPLRYVLFFIFLTLSINAFAFNVLSHMSASRHYQQHMSEFDKARLQGQALGGFIVILLFYIPSLLLMFPLIRHATKKRCMKIRPNRFFYYRLRMFINGYAFPIFIFFLMYLLSAFILGEVSLDSTMPYVCALLLFIPVFFAAIDIPFTTKLEQAE